MAFDKKHYKEIYEYSLHWLSHRPCHESYTGTAITHIQFMLEQIPQFLKGEDYEAAQAIRDAIIKFWNSYAIEKISESHLLNIPEWKELKLPPHHLSPIRCKKSGL